MASRKMIIQMITLIKGQWGYFGKDVSAEVLVNFWEKMLKDIPDNVCELAFLKCMETTKEAPAPANIIEEAKALITSNEPTDEELWAVLVKRLREVYHLTTMFNYTAIQPNGKTQGQNARDKVEKIFNELPYKLQQYVGAKGELMRLSDYGQDELKYEKNRFLKTMPTIAKRQEYSEQFKLMKTNYEQGLLGSGG